MKEAAGELRGSAVLVVDDDQALAEELCEYLQALGMNVMSSSNVAGALSLTSVHAFDLILLDLWLGAESGLDFLHQLRRTHATPVIVMTAQDNIADKIGRLVVEADDHMFKPLKLDVLTASMRSLIGHARAVGRVGTASHAGKGAVSLMREEGGAISIVAALSLAVLLALAALVIDTGVLYAARRDLQAVNDAAALAAVQNPTNAVAIANAVFLANGYASPDLTVTTGGYTADESLSAEARFSTPASPATAVRIRASIKHAAYFAGLMGLSSQVTLVTQSTAARAPTISFGVGTRLADLNGGLINSLLGQLWGGSLSLSLIDYQALLGTNIDTLRFLNQLATDVGTSGTYQQLADTPITTAQLLTAMIETLGSSGAAVGNVSGAKLALQSLQLQLHNATSFKLSAVVDLAPLASRKIGNVDQVAALDSVLNVMSLVSADARAIATGQTINMGAAISVPVVNSAVATRVAIGSPMVQTAVGRVGTTLTTAQIRIALTETLANVSLGPISTSVQLPIYLEAASGQATVAALSCTPNGTLAQISASAGLTSIKFGSVTDAALKNFSTPVVPTSTPVISITLLTIPVQFNISGTGSVGAAGPVSMPFSQADIDAGTVKSVSAVGTPFSTLSTHFTVSPNVSNPLINATLSAILTPLVSLVTNLIAPLDTPVNQTMNTLGLVLGTADVRVFNVNCRTPTLVG